MQAGTLAQAGPVQAWTVTVLVDGVQRPVRSVSLDREISSDLPEQVSGVTGAQPATGRIDWAPLEAVSATSPHPWKRVAGWPPQSGAQVRIYVADQMTSWLVFTGKIDRTTGEALGAMSSQIVDDFDALQAPVSVPVIADRMPARIRPGEPIQAPVKTAVEPWHVAHEALVAAGYGVQVPALVGRSLLRVLMQGSVAPSTGYLAGWAGDVSLAWAKGYQYLAPGPTVTYDPAPQDRPSTIGQRVYIKRHAAVPVSVRVEHVNGVVRRYRFSQVSANVSRLEVFASSPTVAEYSIGSVDVPNSGSVETPWIDLIMGGPQSAALSYVTDSSYSSPATIPVSSAAPDSDVRTIQVTGGAVAVIVEYVWTAEWTGQNFTNRDGTRVHAWGRGIIGALTATRTIEKRKAVNVLSEIAAATLTGMWLDETGVMQWAPSNVMNALAPVKTVTTDTDIVALGWSDSSQHTRSQVLVDVDLARVNLTRDYEVQVWPDGRASNRSLGPSEALEEFIEPGPEFEWIEPDMVFDRASDRGGETFTTGSWTGGVYLFAQGSSREDDVYAWAPAPWLTHVVEKLGMNTWLLRNTNMTLTRTILLETAPAGTSLLPRWRSYPLPFVRARGEIEFTEATLTGASRGPSGAPVLTHDLAHWGTKVGGQAVADWLSARLASPSPVLDRVSILYDPRIQLGDKLTLRSSVLPGFDVDAIVIGKHEDLGESQHMDLTLRVTATRTSAATLADLEAHYAGKNLTALESAWSGATLTQFESAPLSR